MFLLGIVVLGLAVALLLVVWRRRATTAREAMVQARFTAVLESLTAGLAVWSAGGHLVTCNDRFREFYPGVTLKTGLEFEDLIRFTATRGVVRVPDDQIEEWIAARVARLGEVSCEELQTADDRWLEIRTTPTDEGETTVLYTDVTDRRATATALVERRGRFESQTVGLSILVKAVAVGASATSFHGAAREILSLVGVWAGWSAATVYLVSANDARTLTPTGLWYLADNESFKLLRSATDRADAMDDELLCRTVRSGKPIWVTNIDVDPRIPEARRGVLRGIRGLCAVPVKAGGPVVAVLEFFSKEQLTPDTETEWIVASVSDQLGRVFERERTVDGASQS